MVGSCSSSEKQTVLVTGAFGGITKAIVCTLAVRGHKLHTTGRSIAKLEQLAKETGCSITAVDIRDTSRMKDILDTVRPTVLVNNAGTSAAFRLLPATVEEIGKTIDVNLTATLCVTRLALEHMLAAAKGQIITMSSIAGIYPTMPAIYAASKGALHRMSQVIRLELAGMGIRVTEICPGLVHTEFLSDNFKKNMVGNDRMLDSQNVAGAVRYALDAPPHVNISTIELLPVAQVVDGVAYSRVAR